MVRGDSETFTIVRHLFGMQLLVYSAPWCPDCREAKRFLDKHEIPYQEIDIETTPGAADEVIRNTGKRAIPQFVIDGKWVQPYRARPGISLRRDERIARRSEELEIASRAADKVCKTGFLFRRSTRNSEENLLFRPGRSRPSFLRAQQIPRSPRRDCYNKMFGPDLSPVRSSP